MGIQLLQGRDIDIKNYPSDSNALLLNEAALNAMPLKNPVGQIMKGDGSDWHIVGIVKNFIFKSPYEKVEPLMIMGPGASFQVMHIKLNSAKTIAENLRVAEQVFKEYNPQYPFEYRFIDAEYAEKFSQEQRTGTFAALFSSLAILVSCLGLFGLATYMAENRIKEIGVRKVLGASITSIATLLSTGFLKLVFVSFVIASPLSWLAMNTWLQTYSYRISIQWWVFAGAGVLSAFIAIVTVSFHAIKGALANPVKSLRTE